MASRDWKDAEPRTETATSEDARLNPQKRAWPKTVADAVDVLLTKLGESDLNTIKAVERPEGMLAFHFGLGLWIRNNFGLWQGNEALLAEMLPTLACGNS